MLQTSLQDLSRGRAADEDDHDIDDAGDSNVKASPSRWQTAKASTDQKASPGYCDDGESSLSMLTHHQATVVLDFVAVA